MKIRSIFASTILILTVSISVVSQSNADQLKQLILDLQKAPTDRALRERIIKLAIETKPAPVIPREAKELEGAAEYFANSAKTEADFAKAAAEFEKASLIAPWNAAAYYNAAILYEKAKQPEKALWNYEFYILAAPAANDMDAVIKKIGGMKAAAKTAADQRAADEEASRQREAAAERERNRTGGLRLLRANVDGKSYRQTVCGLRADYKQGCTWSEFNGLNWVEPTRSYQGQTYTDKFYWEFDDDVAYLKVVFTDSSAPPQYQLKVVANGPNMENLTWYTPNYLSPGTSKDREWLPANFFKAYDGGKTLVLGFMKAGDDPSANPKKVYNYFMWKTP